MCVTAERTGNVNAFTQINFLFRRKTGRMLSISLVTNPLLTHICGINIHARIVSSFGLITSAVRVAQPFPPNLRSRGATDFRLHSGTRGTYRLSQAKCLSVLHG